MRCASQRATRRDDTMSSDAQTLLYWIRSYHAARDMEGDDDKTYCYWRAREWAAHIIGS